MEDKIYLYNEYYYTLDEINDMYKSITVEKKKSFRDALAHYTLLDILDKCNYDKKIRDLVDSLAKTEAALIDMYGSDCGTPMLALRGMYKRNLRKLINLTGKLAKDDDSRINKFINGEWLLNNIVCLTLGSSFETVTIDDLTIINCSSLSEGECQAIADNFMRDMRGEEIVFYNSPRKIKK